MPITDRIVVGFEFLSTLSLRRATVGQKRFLQKLAISIHALLAESDLWDLTGGLSYDNFYPRSPCGERLNGVRHKCAIFYFYPRSPCGERQALGLPGWLRVLISIHALLAESDPANWFDLWGWTISIHALLAESDLAGPSGPAFLFNFYPRSPCGERLSCAWSASKLGDFYPRSPCGERPVCVAVQSPA